MKIAEKKSVVSLPSMRVWVLSEIQGGGTAKMMCDTCKYATDEGCDKYTITHQVVNTYGEVIDCTEYREDEPGEN